jgi:short-subunit dehydrogenase
MAATRYRAIVTGASAGIGEAFAERLARDGHDLILAARRKDRLDAIAERLAKETGADIEVFALDLSKAADLAKLEERAAADVHLSLLINNAGFGGYRPFVELEPRIADELVDVHVRATVRLTRAALPGMIARDRGAIVNIASLLAFSGTLVADPLPQRVVYAAAKSFMVTFTQTLAGELAGTGVRAMVCCPGIVKTEFHEVQGMDLSHVPRMSSEDIVTATLAGLELGEVICVPALEDASLVEKIGESQRALLGSASVGARSGAGPQLATRYNTTTRS